MVQKKFFVSEASARIFDTQEAAKDWIDGQIDVIAHQIAAKLVCITKHVDMKQAVLDAVPNIKRIIELQADLSLKNPDSDFND